MQIAILRSSGAGKILDALIGAKWQFSATEIWRITFPKSSRDTVALLKEQQVHPGDVNLLSLPSMPLWHHHFMSYIWHFDLHHWGDSSKYRKILNPTAFEQLKCENYIQIRWQTPRNAVMEQVEPILENSTSHTSYVTFKTPDKNQEHPVVQRTERSVTIKRPLCSGVPPLCLRCQNVCWIKACHVFQTMKKILLVHIPWDLDPPPSGPKMKKWLSFRHHLRSRMFPARSLQHEYHNRWEPREPQSCWLFFCVQNEVQSLHPLVEKHVSVGRQDLVQAGFSHRVVRHPKPLRTEGEVRRGRATAVRDEMSWVHVAMVNQHGCELEQILWRAARNKDTKRRE